jgi:hypothetical protein
MGRENKEGGGGKGETSRNRKKNTANARVETSGEMDAGYRTILEDNGVRDSEVVHIDLQQMMGPRDTMMEELERGEARRPSPRQKCSKADLE